ncbi:MAG: hypothetical protein WCD42_01625 [Rhizomicrobium sp.]
MKKVQFLRPVLPIQTGESRILPDGMAAKLVAAGTARIVASVFDKAVPAENGKSQYHVSHAQPKYQTRGGRAETR